MPIRPLEPQLDMFDAPFHSSLVSHPNPEAFYSNDSHTQAHTPNLAFFPPSNLAYSPLFLNINSDYYN